MLVMLEDFAGSLSSVVIGFAVLGSVHAWKKDRGAAA
jgi:hypothetical protein